MLPISFGIIRIRILFTILDHLFNYESMRSGSNVSRRVIIAPAGAEQVRLYLVAFEMPR